MVVPSRPRFTLIVVTSRDGYIAPEGGAPPGVWASREEQRLFRHRVAGLDWAFMGRRTHELAWRPNRRRVVFTAALAGPEWRHPLHLWADPGRVSLDAMLAAATAVHPAVSCGILGGVAVHDWFAAAGLIDAVELTIEPLTFAGGLPLFSWSRGMKPCHALSGLGLLQVEEQPLNAGGTRLLRFERPSGPIGP
jgi:dihydrofolate reductase